MSADSPAMVKSRRWSIATLNASNNSIADISPIAGLTNLTNKDLTGNPCTGCTQLANGDVPIPLWALWALGAALLGAIRRANRRRGRSLASRASR